ERSSLAPVGREVGSGRTHSWNSFATNGSGKTRLPRRRRACAQIVSVDRNLLRSTKLPRSRLRFGIDRLLAERALRGPLAGRRVALVAHPASTTADLVHSLDAIAALGDLTLAAAFGPQHGLRGDKQDNMAESADFVDPLHGIPVFSLYGEVRRPTAAMMEHLD